MMEFFMENQLFKEPVFPFAPLQNCGAWVSPPEEILNHFPHLILAQVFDALSYYADHQDATHEIISQNAVPDDLTHPASHLDA